VFPALISLLAWFHAMCLIGRQYSPLGFLLSASTDFLYQDGPPDLDSRQHLFCLCVDLAADRFLLLISAGDPLYDSCVVGSKGSMVLSLNCSHTVIS
jgi:hypothetical protein